MFGPKLQMPGASYPPTPAPEALECVFVAYAYKIPAVGHGWDFELIAE